MSLTITIDLAPVAQQLGLSLERVESAVRLLDAGNTVPFITRYRKDQTGGLDEEQIRAIESAVTKLRLLAERKQTILRSIDSQGKLTPELAAAINHANSTKRLEDLYLPFKPKKQSLATLARERQLEPLAQEILTGAEAALNLDLRAQDFVNPDKQVASIADVLLGVGHIIAEDFSERADLREKLRRIFKKTGRVVSAKIEVEKKEESKEQVATPLPAVTDDAAEAVADSTLIVAEVAVTDTAAESVIPAINESSAVVETTDVIATAAESSPTVAQAPPAEQITPTTAESEATTPAVETTTEAAPVAEQIPPPAVPAGKPRDKKHKKDKKLENPLEQEFRDYFQYSEQLTRVPPHRVLALNRGERAKVIRVRVEADFEAMHQEAEKLLVPADHPHGDFLRPCVRDALTRLVFPSLERELRRELTDAAETHAVDVFAKNLRNLLLMAPVRSRRVLALDPGFKSGCKIAVLDEFGSLLDHAVIHIIGKAERKAGGRAKVIELIRQHSVTVLAIGNGTACRETEEFVADILATDLAGDTLAYMIVNEAGASVYSTSQLGREEFPDYDATLRGAISIGRRMLDPLSELVKIDPANLGVGLYQHDVKAKHLRASLDAVVESCENYVGVDLNTASPALLRYVSGLNQLKGRQIYDYRSAHGPFKNREQLKEVPGIGEASFVQAAGFLKLTDGDVPLDVTWIHPESYAAARTVLQRLDTAEADLINKETAAALAEKTRSLDLKALSAELQVGELSLADILTQLTRPGRDPREDLPPPIFKRGILKLEDLEVCMELTGSVLNVVDFGAFVDIGLHDSGLVHVSQLANRFVRDPHELVSVGDIVKVWVLEIDKNRRRVSLTMIPPGTKRIDPRREQRKDQPAGEGGRPPRGPRSPRPRQQDGAPGTPPTTGSRPPRGDRRPPRPQTVVAEGTAPPAGGNPSRSDGQRNDGQRGQQRPGGRPGNTPPPKRPEPVRNANMLGPPVEQFGKKFNLNKKPGFKPRPGGGSGFGGGGGGSSYGGGRGGRPDQAAAGGGDQQRTGQQQQKSAKPKPLVPLSDKMKQGKEPLRTFGDLLQFMSTAVQPEAAPVEDTAALNPPSPPVVEPSTDVNPAGESV